MRVDLRRLLDGIQRAAWRVAPIPGERFKHTIDSEGAHHIELTLLADEVEFTPTPKIAPTMGPSAWATPDPEGKRSK